MDNNKISLLVDFYELTMSNGYLVNGHKDKEVYFDYFFRKVPDKGGFAITAGLEQFIDYVKNFNLADEDLKMLKDMGQFDDKFIEYLKNFEFTGDIYAIKEGTPVFPNTPIITVKAPIIQAQLIETVLLNTLNFQSLIATKANRIKRSANNKKVVDFGARRAHSYDASLYGARASYIGGFDGTSNLLAHKEFNIPVVGTMAHSWVQFYDDDKLAFDAYKKAYPKNSTFLIDTFDVLNSGLPKAIEVFKTMEKDSKKGIRLDSGNISYLSKKVRNELDKHGLEDVNIVASNSLDEYKIDEIEDDPDSAIDFYGVGERMITSKSEPVFGGVYKLVAIKEDEEIMPKIKLSEDAEKITNPGLKEIYRLYDNETNKAFSDLLTIKGEKIGKTYKLFDELMPWKSKVVKNFEAKKLQEKIIEDGKVVYEFPTLKEIREYRKKEINKLWDSLLKLNNPDRYFVNLSFDLWGEKRKLLEKYSNKNEH